MIQAKDIEKKYDELEELINKHQLVMGYFEEEEEFLNNLKGQQEFWYNLLQEDLEDENALANARNNSLQNYEYENYKDDFYQGIKFASGMAILMNK